MKNVLVVGGTGPSGPWLVEGLLKRGLDVSVLHRGTHEASGADVEFMNHVEHIHADPHFSESLNDALAGRQFDIVIATYGRTRVVAESCVGKCDRFYGIGGMPAYLGQFDADQVTPYGMRLLASEESPLADTTGAHIRPPSDPPAKIVATERSVFSLHDEGKLDVTWFRYPSVYGPRNPRPHEWYVLRRALDGRKQIVVPDAGLTIRTRAAGRNAAHAVLCAVDNPSTARGRTYNVGDDQQFTFRQWAEVLADICGIAEVEIVSLPWELARPTWGLLPRGDSHALMDTSRIRAELGYTDLIAPVDALTESVQWYRANPVSDETAARYGLFFDYPAEESLISAYRDSSRQIDVGSEVPFVDQGHHIYAHPTQVGNEVGDSRGR